VFLERFIEKRYTFTHPSSDFYDAWTGGEGPTASGERISPERALGLSAYHAAMRAISEDIAKLPLPLYERLRPRGKKRRPDHPVYGLIHDRPNPETGAMAFWETIMGHGLGHGNGVAEIVRTVGGDPIAMWLLDPRRIRIYRDDDGQLRYELHYDNQESRILHWTNVFHLHGFGFDGLTGYSIARYARETLGEVKAAGTAGAAFFGNNSRPGGVIEFDVGIGPKDPKALRKEFEDGYKGADKFNKIAVLPYPLKFKPIAIPNEDAQWIQGRQFCIEEIARWFRMPPHKLQHLIYGTYANVDHLAIEYVVDTLTSWMKRIEQEIWYKLIPAHEKAKLFAEFLPEGLLRGDIKVRHEVHALGRQWGYRSANDVREIENENPLPGDQGDIYMIPANMMDASKINEEPKNEPTQVPIPDKEPTRAAVKLLMADMTRRLASDASETGGERLPEPAEVIARTVAAHAPLLRDAYARTLHVECDKIQRATRRPQFDKWCREFRETHKAHVEEAIRIPVESLFGVVWAVLREGEPNGELTEHIRGMADRYTRRASSRLWRQKSDIDEYATTEVTEELPKLTEMLVELCTESGDANANPK
jgi:HK97 family phage portal protein